MIDWRLRTLSEHATCEWDPEGLRMVNGTPDVLNMINTQQLGTVATSPPHGIIRYKPNRLVRCSYDLSDTEKPARYTSDQTYRTQFIWQHAELPSDINTVMNMLADERHASQREDRILGLLRRTVLPVEFLPVLCQFIEQQHKKEENYYVAITKSNIRGLEMESWRRQCAYVLRAKHPDIMDFVPERFWTTTRYGKNPEDETHTIEDLFLSLDMGSRQFGPLTYLCATGAVLSRCLEYMPKEELQTHIHKFHKIDDSALLVFQSGWDWAKLAERDSLSWHCWNALGRTGVQLPTAKLSWAALENTSIYANAVVRLLNGEDTNSEAPMEDDSQEHDHSRKRRHTADDK